MEDLGPKLEEMKEWDKVVIFDQTGKVLIKKNCEVSEEEIKQMLESYADRDKTITQGFMLNKVHFEVHRFHPPLIYGRIENETLNEGICLVKGKNSKEEVIYMLITYLLPIVSARAIPQQIEFYNSNIGEIDKLYQ